MRGLLGVRVGAEAAAVSPSVIHQLITAVTVESDADERRRVARERLAVVGDRVREVALAVSRGLTNAEAAEKLFIGVTTVKIHVSSILTKLGLDNRVQFALLIHDVDDR
ncbi:LuxR C-terminal-related transcriptional regulator [Streptomyces sp. NPDC055287]